MLLLAYPVTYMENSVTNFDVAFVSRKGVNFAEDNIFVTHANMQSALITFSIRGYNDHIELIIAVKKMPISC